MAYLPWIGDHYSTGAFFGQRVLLVGESHYDDSEDPELTRSVVGGVCDGSLRLSFFTRLGRACIGKAGYEQDPARFWNSVAFMNFVPEPVSHSKERPTRTMLAAAERTFLDRISQLQPLPDRILVFSAVAWDSMPPFLEGTERNFEPAQQRLAWCGCYELPGGHLAAAMYAQHPGSRGWNAQFWRNLVTKFLGEPKLPQDA